MIVGIDPGSHLMGFALIKSTDYDSLTWIDSGVWKATRTLPLYRRLGILLGHFDSFVQKYRPDVVVLEKSFYGLNAKTAMNMGESRGVILSLVGSHGVALKEYTPTTVKMAVTGYGRSTKMQVQEMLRNMFPVKQSFETDDESDALALAVTYHYRESRGNGLLCSIT